MLIGSEWLLSWYRALFTHDSVFKNERLKRTAESQPLLRLTEESGAHSS